MEWSCNTYCSTLHNLKQRVYRSQKSLLGKIFLIRTSKIFIMSHGTLSGIISQRWAELENWNQHYRNSLPSVYPTLLHFFLTSTVLLVIEQEIIINNNKYREIEKIEMKTMTIIKQYKFVCVCVNILIIIIIIAAYENEARPISYG